MSNELVLVTGGSGFVGVHCIVRLLNAHYRVRATVRSLRREADVRTMVKTGGTEPGQALTFATTDLMSGTGWPEAIADCTYAIHVASPFPSRVPKHENELIVPAREGTLRVLHAARDAGVKRIVITSSFAAIGYGHPPTDRPFSEETWTEVDNQSAYVRSKTLAERAAWDFVAREGGALELSVINPTCIFGPALGPDFSSSVGIVKALMDGAMPRLPRIAFGVVDVRDVADLHLRAMIDPGANGERFLASASDIISLQDIAVLLRARLGYAARRVPTKVMPDWILRVASGVSPTAAAVVPDLGKIRRSASEKAGRVLGWKARSNEDAIIATAESLVRLGLLRGGRKSVLQP